MAVVEVKFLGSGDAFSSGGRFQTCILITSKEACFLVDCGATSLMAMRKYEVEPNSIGTILISHLHGDHFGGLPFFLMDAKHLSKRQEPLVIAGPKGIKERVIETMEALYPGSTEAEPGYKLIFREFRPGVRTGWRDLAVETHPVNHPSGAPSLALRIDCAGKVIAFSGDTGWCDGLAEAARGANLLITECYTYEELLPYHLDYRTLQVRLPGLGIKRIVYTHMNSEMLKKAGELEGEFAEDGLVLQL